MTRAILLLAVLGCRGFASSDPVREVSGPSLSDAIPGFYQGHYYWNLEPGDGRAAVYGPDGLLAFNYQPHDGMKLQGLGFDTDGSAAIAWWSKDGSGIDLVNAAGSLVKTVKTGLFMPGHCGFAEDHSMWCIGTQLRSLGSATVPSKDNYMTVRRFLQDGTQAGAYLPRSALPAPALPDYWNWQRTVITLTHDRVGLWVISEGRSNRTDWVELDLNGNLLGWWPLGGFTGQVDVALTADDHVYLEHVPPMSNQHSLYRLDRASSTWQPVDGPANSLGRLAGGAGNQLVFRGYGPNGAVHFWWYDQPLP